MNKIKILSLFVLLLGVLFSCKKPPEPHITTPYELEIPRFFPTRTNIPVDNPLTVEGVELGRYLFYDGRLSGRTHVDSLMSCASCHKQSRSFDVDPNQITFQNGRPVGLGGTPTPHAVLPLINLVWNESGYMWNGSFNNSNPDKYKKGIEGIVYHTLIDPNEINGDTTNIVTLIQNTSGYPELFEKAFGTKIVTVDGISKAIAQFVRTLISYNSKFDKYLRGEVQLTTDELMGYELFMTEEGADCFHCHGGDGNPLFTTNLFYNNGTDSVFNDPFDRFSVTGVRSDIGAYKASTLRNIVHTAPYMHDGRFSTLDEVIEFYSTGIIVSEFIHPLMHHANNGGTKLTPIERRQLTAFLNALTDESFITNPDFGPPTQLPDGATPLSK